MSKETQATKIIRELLQGTFTEDELDRVSQTLKVLRETQQIAKKAQFRIGSLVTFVESVRPAYLAGAEATVVKINRKRLLVRLSKPAGRFHGTIRCPVSLLSLKA